MNGAIPLFPQLFLHDVKKYNFIFFLKKERHYNETMLFLGLGADNYFRYSRY